MVQDTFHGLMDRRDQIHALLKDTQDTQERNRLLQELGEIIRNPLTEPWSRGWASGSTDVTETDLTALSMCRKDSRGRLAEASEARPPSKEGRR